jgi:glycosyltransferase involved in cell wall biosynthesis
MSNSIAVVIPCFNSASSLPRALDSIVNQSVKVDEILVIDDCSSDSSQIKKICDSFDSIKYFRNKVNLGLAGSRNVGIHNANSEIITFLDADDQFHVNKIKFQLRYLKDNHVVATEVCRVTNGTEANPTSTLKKNFPIRKFISPYQNLFFNKLVGSSLMAYKSTLCSVDGYDANLRSVEDFDLWIRLLSQDIVVILIKSPLYLYYDSFDSLSKDSNTVWSNIVRVVKKFISSKDIKQGSPFEQLIWLVLLCKELIKAEGSNNKKLKNQLAIDITTLLSTNVVIVIFKILKKINFFKVLSFLLIKKNK